jgi:hypothetical protein
VLINGAGVIQTRRIYENKGLRGNSPLTSLLNCEQISYHGTCNQINVDDIEIWPL